MSYRCKLNQRKECEGCKECDRNDPSILCDNCEEQIEDKSYYYKIGNEIYCEECLRLLYGIYKD